MKCEIVLHTSLPSELPTFGRWSNTKSVLSPHWVSGDKINTLHDYLICNVVHWRIWNMQWSLKHHTFIYLCVVNLWNSWIERNCKSVVLAVFIGPPMLSKSSFRSRTPEQKIFIYSNCNIYFNSVKFLVLVKCCCNGDFPRPNVYTVCQNYI